MPLTLSTVNRRIVSAQYAVRGRIAVRAEQIREELKTNPTKFKFSKIINANIGNPQQLDQRPITFYRQVLALVQYPKLLENPRDFASDAVKRAQHLLEAIGSVGAYSSSNGVPIIRQSVADFISRRDGLKADPEDIFLSAGASAAVAKILNLIVVNNNCGALVPVPQYPLYSATLELQGAKRVDYYLDEQHDWGTNKKHIEQQYADAKADGIDPKLLVVINPGNPTGAILDEANMKGICEFALKNDLVLLADEVYQANVYQGEFTSFRKIRDVLIKEDPSYNELQLASVHSTSKGTIGECGQRGGYLEVAGFKPEVKDLIYKLASIELCPIVTGQVLTELMVNPPKKGDESYELFAKENTHIFDTLKERAEALYSVFQELEGVTCNAPQGAMYLFPRITVPPKACQEAEKQGITPDEFYCMELLENAGVCVVAGSGFGQEPNTLHFRTTFLAPGGEEFHKVFIDFHKEFMAKYK